MENGNRENTTYLTKHNSASSFPLFFKIFKMRYNNFLQSVKFRMAINKPLSAFTIIIHLTIKFPQ